MHYTAHIYVYYIYRLHIHLYQDIERREIFLNKRPHQHILSSRE